MMSSYLNLLMIRLSLKSGAEMCAQMQQDNKKFLVGQNDHDLRAMLHHLLFFLPPYVLHFSVNREPLTEPHGGSSTSHPTTSRSHDDTHTLQL